MTLAGRDWARLAASRQFVLALWAAWAVLCVVLVVPLHGPWLFSASDPDDYMRLMQVRDLLAGQSWFDVTQYRMGPPDGAAMHWSRLVDIPLAGLMLALRPLLGVHLAEYWATVLVPVLWLGPALFALRAMAVRLGMAGLALAFTLILLPMFPLLPTNFSPFRIDHHTAQSVAALVCAALLVHAPTRAAALAGGLVAAAWLVISVEALPLIAALAAIYGLRYVALQDRSLGAFLGALAVGVPALTLATRPLSQLTGLYCDIVLPGHMAAFAAAAVIAIALPMLPGQASWRGRLAALAVVPIVCGPLAFISLGQCAGNPFGTLHPLLKTWWHGRVLEGMPIWKQSLAMVLAVVWTIALVPAGWWLALRQRRDMAAWSACAVFALCAGSYSLLVLREALITQLLALPFAALLLAHWLPRARAVQSTGLRIAATLGVLALATPIFAGAMAKQLANEPEVRPVMGGECDYATLAALPRGHIFLPLDRGAEILVKTPHTVVSGGYHRNQARMADVVAAYTGDAATAERIVKANGATHVIACLSSPEIAIYRTARPGNLADRLATGKAPAWLAPVPGFTGALKVWQVR